LSLATQASSQIAPQTPDKLLLREYRPRSIYKIPQTKVPKARYAAIDAHAHPYANTDEEIVNWVRTMDEVGIEKAVILTAATRKEFNEIAAKYRKHPGRFELWCGIDFTGYDQSGFGPAAIAELESCRRAGAAGVGEISDKGQGISYGTGESRVFAKMHLDDPRLNALWEKCADLGLSVNVHIGEDQWMYGPMDETNDGLMNAFAWRLDNQPGLLSHDQLLATLERTAVKHPRTIFIACHFANCCADLGRLGTMLDAHPNLYADISARYGETAPIPRFMAGFYERYQDRLLYGTDMGDAREMYQATFRILETADEHFYEFELFDYHWPLHGFALADGILKKIYRDNALKIAGKIKGR
jgi:predicted TIM-barrel fold metal-dependent hydrolase